MTEINDPLSDTSFYKSGDLIGNYRLQEKLGGEENFAFKSIRLTDHKNVVIKFFSKKSQKASSLFDSEVRAFEITEGIPGVLQLMEKGENNGSYFIVTEHMSSGTLRDVLRQKPDGMDIRDIFQVFTPLANAIDQIHGRNIIHCDLKPDNVLLRKVNDGYETYITDFGLARFVDSSQSFTTDTINGTQNYLAPEAWDPNRLKTSAIDVYAFGVMLYEAFEGKVPYENPVEPPEDPIPYPERTEQKTNSAVVKSLLKALQHEPEQRPKSTGEIVDEIRDMYEGKTERAQSWIGIKFKQYIVEDVLGEGKISVSLRAKDTLKGDQVVLKAFTRDYWSGKPRQAFNKELTSLKRLENGHGVLVPRDIFEHNDIFFIVTDYKTGGNLRQLLNKRPRGLPKTEILDIFSQIAAAIDYIHNQKVIHCDIKPENIVYSLEGDKITTYITDFGIAQVLADSKTSFYTRTSAGTFRYMAPELWDPKARKTKTIDTYAFGIMLYEALEGHPPFEADFPAIMFQQIKESVPGPKNLKRLGLGPEAQIIFFEALAKNADERPKTATEIIQRLKGKQDTQTTAFLGKRFGKYEVEKFLGRGAMGITFKAADITNRKRKVALKIFPPSFVSNKQEVEILKKLEKIEGILALIDDGFDNGYYYLVTEYLNGNNLRNLLEDYPDGMDFKDAIALFKPIAEALDSLHAKQIIHRDLKPENIVLRKTRTDDGTPSYHPYITDFGISRTLDKTQSLHSKSKILAGTFRYMAPEVWENKDPSSANDIYALGIMLYEALEGEAPFTANTLPGIMRQHLNDEVPTPENLIKTEGRKAVNVLLKSLEKKPERRQKTAQELISGLEKAADDRVSAILGRIFEPFIVLQGLFKRRWKMIAGSVLTILVFLSIAFAYKNLLLLMPLFPPTETSTPTLSMMDTPVPSPSQTSTPSETITPSPTTTAISFPATIPAGFNYCRLGPGMNYEVIETLSNQTVTVIGKNEFVKWLLVIVQDPDRRCWISKNIVRGLEYKDLVSLPIVNVDVYGFPVPTTTSTEAVASNITPPTPMKTIHVAGLPWSSSGQGKWTATVTTLVHDAQGLPVSGVKVNSKWDNGTPEECTTGLDGKCDIEEEFPPYILKATLTINSLSITGYISSIDPEKDKVTVDKPSK